MHSITFLGTGGGRFVLLSQRRYTGGIWFDLGVNMIIDPGPGALIRALQFGRNPSKLNAVFVSHRHLDHYNDAELMIEAMTHGLKKTGILVINKNTLDYISEYHRNSISVIIPDIGEKFRIHDLEIQAIPTIRHENGIGFKFFTEEEIITYSSDTDYSPELIRYYKDSKILILNVISPDSKKTDKHLNTEKAIKIVKRVRPELTIIQHFGMRMLNANPNLEAMEITRETGVRTIAARDGMTIDLRDLEISEVDGQKRLFDF
ncbi:MAG: MBL fold metallo-hydrolase [Candidatus Altiarchaeales archaeon]|nr:MAG: MBL fold metallo-hydrolase [Candidatus Altiarchaeales archaeon]RLI94629.1 MAG: MBL fold metallo-hydrolase [Candidatus Altiarchaeales archaeon]HDO82052.1 MBL fold metallo-hydrolase [Candidatus Altiarchaeales archaeon]HEX54701.1 MBL fold metallo-hydrolase [Candidatus Altiarchaeales archaeon]